MPIRFEIREHYSKTAGWPETRTAILARAGDRCECVGECGGCEGRCGAPDRTWIQRDPGRPWRWRPSRQDKRPTAVLVILTVAHLNRRSGDDRPENLKALCQRCHLVYDRKQHLATRARTIHSAQAQAGQLALPLGTGP